MKSVEGKKRVNYLTEEPREKSQPRPVGIAESSVFTLILLIQA